MSIIFERYRAIPDFKKDRFLAKEVDIWRCFFFFPRIIFSFQRCNFPCRFRCGMRIRPVVFGKEKQAPRLSQETHGVVRPAFKGTGAQPGEDRIPARSRMCGVSEWGGHPSKPEPFYRRGNSEKLSGLLRVT